MKEETVQDLVDQVRAGDIVFTKGRRYRVLRTVEDPLLRRVYLNYTNGTRQSFNAGEIIERRTRQKPIQDKTYSWRQINRILHIKHASPRFIEVVRKSLEEN